MKKINRFRYAISFKCPVCGKSSIFENPKTYAIRKLGSVKPHCEHCKANLKPETGFYFGAAYVNWALTVALWISVLVALKTFDLLGWIEFGFLTHPETFLTTGFILTIVLFPVIFRLSRSIWAAFFVFENSDQRNTNFTAEE